MPDVARLCVTLCLKDQKFDKKMKNLESKISGLGSKFDKLGKSLSLKLTAPIGILGTVAVRTFLTFEKSMNRVRALVEESGGSFKGLTELAEEMGRTTVFTAKQSAQALAEMAQLGIKSKDLFKALPQTLNLAAAGSIELADASRITAGIMNSMGIEAQNLNRVVDVLAKASASSGANVSDLGQVFQKAGGIAKLAGVSLEEVAAIAGVFRDRSQEAGISGRALKSIISDLSKSAGPAAKEFQKLGVKTLDINGRIRPMADIIDDVNAAFVRMGKTSAEQTTILAKAFGDNFFGQFALLLDAGGQKIREFEGQLKGSAGAAQRIADKQLDGLSGAFTLMGSAVEGVGNTIAKILKPSLDKVANLIIKVTKFFQKLNPTLQKITVGFLAFGAAIGPVLIGLSAMVTLLPSIVSGYKLLGPAIVKAQAAVVSMSGALNGLIARMAALSAPILLAVATIALIANVISMVVSNWDQLVEAFREGGEILAQILSNFFNEAKTWMVDKLGPVFKSIVDQFNQLGAIIGDWVTVASSFYRESFLEAKKWLADKLLLVINKAIGFYNKLAVLWDGHLDTLSDFEPIEEGAAKTFKFVEKQIKDSYKAAAETAGNASQEIASKIKTVGEVAKISAGDLATALDDAFKESAKSAETNFTKIRDKISGIVFNQPEANKPDSGGQPTAENPGGGGLAGSATAGMQGAMALFQQFSQAQKAVADATALETNRMAESWLGFSTTVEARLQEFQDVTQAAFQTFADGFATAVADSILLGESFADSMKAVFIDIGRQIIAMLIKIGIQRLASALVEKAASKSSAVSQVGAAQAVAVANSIAAYSGIPFVGLQLGLAAASAAVGAISAGSAPFLALAEGGIINSPTLGLVGEAGPEAVIPLDQMENMNGGDQTIIINLDGREMTRRVVKEMPSILRVEAGLRF